MSFENKVVLITGAGSGMGAATALAFSKEGAHLSIIDINEETLEEVAIQCEKFGKKPLTFTANITDDKRMEYIVQKTIEQFEKLDVLVNNAGIYRQGRVLEGLMKSYDEVMNTNLRAAVNLTCLAAPHLVKTRGNIVNISSITSVCACEHIAYSISKAALDHFTRNAALELGRHGVRVNAINPGGVNTNIIENATKSDPDVRASNINVKQMFIDLSNSAPLGRVSDPKEIADMVLYVAGDKANGIIGSNFFVDNGLRLPSKC